jgi:hypothetical protein
MTPGRPLTDEVTQGGDRQSLNDGYEGRALQETPGGHTQFEKEAKKRREQGKVHRGAQSSEHRGSYSLFMPYTV